MHFTTTAVLALLAGISPAFAAPTVPQSPFIGTINTPAPSTPIEAGTPFDFSYGASNWCEEGYNRFKVFLTSGTVPPTFDDLDNTGDISSALFGFGEYTVANFGGHFSPRLLQENTFTHSCSSSGLPPISPPPAQFVAPSVAVPGGESAYLSVVQIFNSCPVSPMSR